MEQLWSGQGELFLRWLMPRRRVQPLGAADQRRFPPQNAENPLRQQVQFETGPNCLAPFLDVRATAKRIALICDSLRVLGEISIAGASGVDADAAWKENSPRAQLPRHLTGRSFERWARSANCVFCKGSRNVVGNYLTALACHDHLRRNTACHVQRYGYLMADPSGVCRLPGQFLNVEFLPDAIAAATIRDAPGREGRLEKTLVLWKSDKVADAQPPRRGRLELDRGD
ncbi:MAG: hypothetical protein ACXWLK_10440, partial [Rhizomicrobium sp.]